VLVANAGIGIYQELRAKRTLDSLAVLTSPRARLVRDGELREAPLTEVVLDDVLELQPGDQVVVDGEVLEASALEVDESLLTGEAEPVIKEPGDEVLSGRSSRRAADGSEPRAWARGRTRRSSPSRGGGSA
jgi:cation-transporting ATPase E